MSDEILKGGKGSGVKGHTTQGVNKYGTAYSHHEDDGLKTTHEKHEWGSMRSAKTGKDGINGGAMIHPEHWEEMKHVALGFKDQSHFRDEQKRTWKVTRHEKGGVQLHDTDGGQKIHVTPDHMMNLHREPEKSPADLGNEAATTDQKRKEIHEYHKEHSDKATQDSIKRHLDPKNTDDWSHKNRVDSEHSSMTRRPSIKETSNGKTTEYAQNKYGQVDRSKVLSETDTPTTNKYGQQDRSGKKQKEDVEHFSPRQREAMRAASYRKQHGMKKSDPLNPEPIYNAQERPYAEDINDMIEKANKNKKPVKDDGDYRNSLKEKEMDQFKIDEHGRKIPLEKGGAGSGTKGHKTVHETEHVRVFEHNPDAKEYKVQDKKSGASWHMNHNGDMGIGGSTPEKHQNGNAEKDAIKYIESRHAIKKDGYTGGGDGSA